MVAPFNVSKIISFALAVMTMPAQAKTLCTIPSGVQGTCISTSSCSGQGGVSTAGYCPGSASIQCCTSRSLSAKSSGDADSLSAHGVKFIEQFEGWRADFYRDAAGVKTIGYGHACQPASSCNHIKAPISRATGSKLLREDAHTAVSCINRNVKVKLTQNQFDALVSFTYNLGCGPMAMVAKNLNAKRFKAATDEIMLYNRAGGKPLSGLTRRRRAEVKLFDT